MSEAIDTNAEPGILYVEMLGGLRVRRGDVVLAQYTPQQTGALLALLALNLDRPCARETLIETIWPNADVESGRASLRQGLYKLRQQLEPTPLPEGGLFLRTQTDIQLNPAVVTTDVLAFERALQEGGTDPVERLRHLSEAVDIYRDPLLPGFYQEVFVLERRRLLRAFQTALRDLTITAEVVGDLEGAIECTRKAMGRFPQSAEIRIALVRLCTSAGQPAEALREVENLYDLWQRKSAEAPDEATRTRAEQYERTARAALRVAPAAEPAVRPAARFANASVGSVDQDDATTRAIPAEQSPDTDQTFIRTGRTPVGRADNGRAARRFLAWAVVALLSSIGALVWHRRTVQPASHTQLGDRVPMHRLHLIEQRFSWDEGALDPVHHRLYLPNTGTAGPNGVEVVDTDTYRNLAPIPAGVGLFGAAVDAQSDRICVASRQTDRMSLWDTRTGKQLNDFLAGSTDIADLAFDPDSRKFFILSAQPPVLTTLDSGGARLNNQPMQASGAGRVIPDSRYLRVFVVSRDSNTVQVFNRDTLRLISLMVTDVSPTDLAVDDERNRIFVTNAKSGTLDVFDGTTYIRITTLTLGDRQPNGIALDPVTGRLYVCCTQDDSLIVVNSVTLQIEHVYNTTPYGAVHALIDASARRLYLLAPAINIAIWNLP